MKFTLDERHPDLQILCQYTRTLPENLGDAAHGGDEGFECHYLKTPYLQYWSPSQRDTLITAVQEANQKTTEYQFEIVYFEDYEVEFDNDRCWDATFHFKALPKQGLYK